MSKPNDSEEFAGSPWDAERVCSWLQDLICAWRERAGTANPNGPWYVDLSAPLQAEVVVVRSSSAPVEASGVVFQRSPQEADLRIDCIVLDAPSMPSSHDEDPVRGWVIDELRAKVSDATANWSLGGRYLPEPIWKLVFQSRRLLDGPVPLHAWFVARPLEQLPPVHQLVSLPLGIAGSVPNPGAPPAPPEGPVQHVRHLPENDREIEAFTRWVFHHGDELMTAMGVFGPWWLGLFLDRRDVFGEPLQGDIDFLGGPLEVALSADQKLELLKAETAKWDASTPQHAIQSFAAERAAANQTLYVWPPKLDSLVAGELKVSWFDPAGQDMKPRDVRRLRARGEPVVPGKWHGVHRGKGVNARSELQLLVDHGFERVAFFHLGAADPQSSQANAWIQGMAHADDAEKKQDLLYDPGEMPACGYLSAVMGAVPHKHEGLAGAGGSVRVVVEPPPNPVKASWKAHLLAELQKLPPPSVLSPFVRACPHCKAWVSLPSPYLQPCAGCAASSKAPAGPAPA
ncbi:MAG: hypothetical protein M9894_17585 [Planctomycetes bacterium]|nr:hypothetical protein [Planctomycetota bacterium]